MPFQVTINDVVREYELFAPVGWEYFVDKLFTDTGRDGLPLLTMLHGGGQSVQGFKQKWDFLTPFLGPTVDIKDRFFVLVPYGSTYYDLAGESFRGWNAGYSGGLNEADDGAFLLYAQQTAQQWLDDRLAALGSSRRSIDPERRFLFGYSNGGMMAYRLVNQYAGVWRALWVQSASYGGKQADGYTALVENPPFATTGDVSLFAHHGDADIKVVPGLLNDTAGINISTESRNIKVLNGVSLVEADNLTRSDRTLAGAALAYRTHNALASPAYSNSTTEDDRDGGQTSQRVEWRNAAGDPTPSVVVYRDPTMTHTNFAESPDRYFSASDVWDWFKTQAP